MKSPTINTCNCYLPAFLATALAPFGASSLHADETWKNVGPVWNIAANWVSGTAPTGSSGAGNTVTFSDTGANFNSVSFTSNRATTGLVFTSTANAYTLENNTFSLTVGSSGIAHGATNLQTINTPIITSASQSWTTVAGGTLNVDSATLTNSAANRTLTIAGAGTTNIGALGFTAGQTGVGSVSVTSTGITTLSRANSYAGTTTVASGSTLKLGNATALGTNASGTTVSSGGVLDLSGQTIGTEALTLSGTGISTGGALVNTSATPASLSGAVTLNTNTSIGAGNITLGSIGETGGARSLTKVGAGTLTLGGTLSYTNGTTISDGVIDITGGNNAPGLFTLSGATGPVLKLSNVNALAASATLLGASSSANTGTVDFAVAGTYTLGAFTGNNMKFTASSGSATSLTFTNNSTITSGGSGGRTLTNSDANLSILFGGTLDISSTLTGNGVTFSGSGNTTVTGAVFNGVTSRTLDKTGSGTLTLNGNNNYGGNTTIGGSGQVLINGNSTASTGPVFVSSSATLGGSGTVGGAVALSSTASIGTAGNTLGLASTLTTSGTNTLNASSTVNVAGGTTVSSGTFTVNGTLGGGAIAVNAGTLTIGGAGSINGAGGVTIASGAGFKYNSATAFTGSFTNNGGTISGNGTLAVNLGLNSLADVVSPGNSPGIQTFGATQTWTSFTYDWEVNNFTSPTAGTGFDQIAITGGLDLTGGTAYALNVLSLTAGNVSGVVPNFGESSMSWTILTTMTGITAFDAGIWTINSASFAALNGSTGTFTLELANAGNDLSLVYTPIPEPSTYAALVGFGALGLVAYRRRKTTKLAA